LKEHGVPTTGSKKKEPMPLTRFKELDHLSLADLQSMKAQAQQLLMTEIKKALEVEIKRQGLFMLCDESLIKEENGLLRLAKGQGYADGLKFINGYLNRILVEINHRQRAQEARKRADAEM
jgi:hypothetical protein